MSSHSDIPNSLLSQPQRDISDISLDDDDDIFLSHSPNGTSNTNGVHLTNGTSHTNGAHFTNGTSHTNGTHLTNGTSHTNGAHHTNGTAHTNGEHLTNGHTRTPSAEMPVSPSNNHGTPMIWVGVDPADNCVACMTPSGEVRYRETARMRAEGGTSNVPRTTRIPDAAWFYKELLRQSEQHRHANRQEIRVLKARIDQLEVALKDTSTIAESSPVNLSTSPAAPSTGSHGDGPPSQTTPTPTLELSSESSKAKMPSIPENDIQSTSVPSGLGLSPHEANLTRDAGHTPMLIRNLDGTTSGNDTPTQAQHPHLATGAVSDTNNQLDEDPALTGPLGLGRGKEEDKKFFSDLHLKLKEEHRSNTVPSPEASSSVPRDPRIQETLNDPEPRLRLKRSTNFGTEFGSTRDII